MPASSMDQAQLNQISVQAELDRIGWAYEFVGDDELKVRCPAHDDSTASASINVSKHMWNCHTAGCEGRGDVVTFLALALKTRRDVVIADLSKRYSLEEVRSVDSRSVERYHEAISRAGPMLKELQKRGIDDEAIRAYRLGFHNGRITIPIRNESGLYVNVRRYLPGAPSKEKMKNMRGHGKVRLFPIEQLKYDTIIVCGGEIKAIAVAQRLNEYGFGAISTTGGEGKWAPEFAHALKDKRVFVCYDVDREGRIGADRVCAATRASAKWIGRIDLPLDSDKWPHGDVNDYFGAEGKTAADFLKLLEEVKAWEPTTPVEEVDNTITEVDVAQATKARHAGKRVRLKGLVAAVADQPYLVPRKVIAACDRNQSFCAICPVYSRPPDDEGRCEMTLPSDSMAIIEMVNVGAETQRKAIRKGLKIPPCKNVSFGVLSHWNVEEVRIAEPLDIQTTSENRLLTALSVSHGLEGNALYEFVGRVYPHPRTQAATMLINDQTPSEDALTTYQPSEEVLDSLAVFQPREWTVDAVDEHLTTIYDDLAANVTRIFKRRSIHLAADLGWHSPLLLNFDGQVVKGWTEVLVLGDSAQGKSDTVIGLMNHYGLGDKVEAKNASVAGLLGGLQQFGSRWFITWGKFPQQDRRLIVIEELKGASTETIGKLTDMRSSGVAEIDKIEKRRTHARTRLVAISNPRGDQPLSTYSYGIKAVMELIGSPEDVRRFDFVTMVTAGDIDADELNRFTRSRPRVDHRFRSELCRSLVLWAWTRRPEEIEFTQEATTLILDEATRLCSMYTDVVPLVDRGSMRFKIARLSAALAARTFSCGPTKRVLVVRPCHVQFIVRLLIQTYSAPTFGYSDFSDAYKATRTLRDQDKIESKLRALPYPRDFAEQMLRADAIELRDIQDWCGWESGEAIELLSFLVRKHAVTRDGRAYRKNPLFIQLLKQLRDMPDRPDHVEEL